MNRLKDFKKRLELLKEKLEFDKIKKEVADIETQAAESGFWQDKEKATKKMKRMAYLQKEMEIVWDLEKSLKEGKIAEVEEKIKKIELRIFLSGEYDSLSALVSIHAGQGGVEAMDWAQMIERMYLKYFEKKAWRHQVLDEGAGEEAGIKTATIAVDEPYAYGYLKFEAGTHRLVRQSPFNADRLRQTSFALVEVLPQITEKEEVEINEADLEWQFYRASTQGGQNVQKVSTAVRLRHQPSGIVVTCQVERRQEQNRKIALQLLRARLWQKETEKKEKEIEKLKGGRTKAAWGTQIRSYVLHPYKMVKDLRTGFETQAAEAVLDGNLDEFIQVEVRKLSKIAD